MPQKTNTRTISEYFELYAGPEFEVYSKYSDLETTCCICFLFGPGIPVLFPLGLMSITVVYILDKYGLAKLYR